MKKQNKEAIIKDMDEVIASTKDVREILRNPDISTEEKIKQLGYLKWIILANKNIVSATTTKISVEKLKETEE